MPRLSLIVTGALAISKICVLAAQTAPPGLRSSRDSVEHVIQLGDFINILRLDGGCTLGRDHIPLKKDGSIILPLIGKVNAQGLTASQLTADIESKLSKYVLHPEVRLVVVEPTRKTPL